MNPEPATPTGGAAPGPVIPSLDGIRAVAVGLVFFAHSGLEHIVPGSLGVTVFFVLSGFLITTLLRLEHASSGAISYRSFYLRRVLRLMPPLVVVVALAALLAALGVAEGSFEPLGLLSVLFYFGNYYVIATDFNGIVAGIGVMWSLAVEEHYYLFYPPLAALLLRIGRVGTSASVLLALCLAVLGWRCVLTLNGVGEDYLTMATDTRIDAILFGCVMALWRNPWLDRRLEGGRLADWGVIAACVSVLLATLLYRDEFFRMTLRYTLQSMAIVPLLYLAVARAERLPFRWLNSRPLVYIGTVSYTVYLSHHVILLMVDRHLPQLGWGGTLGLTAALTLALCECMRRWVEVPCARLRKRLHRDALLRTAKAKPQSTDTHFLPGSARAGAE